MRVKVGEKEIEFDSYECIPDEKTIKFYKNKDIDLMGITVSTELLSDFGKEVFKEQIE